MGDIADDLTDRMTDVLAAHIAGDCDEDCEWCNRTSGQGDSSTLERQPKAKMRAAGMQVVERRIKR